MHSIWGNSSTRIKNAIDVISSLSHTVLYSPHGLLSSSFYDCLQLIHFESSVHDEIEHTLSKQWELVKQCRHTTVIEPIWHSEPIPPKQIYLWSGGIVNQLMCEHLSSHRVRHFLLRKSNLASYECFAHWYKLLWGNLDDEAAPMLLLTVSAMTTCTRTPSSRSSVRRVREQEANAALLLAYTEPKTYGMSAEIEATLIIRPWAGMSRSTKADHRHYSEDISFVHVVGIVEIYISSWHGESTSAVYCD
jgi:hypothetical protein